MKIVLVVLEATPVLVAESGIRPLPRNLEEADLKPDTNEMTLKTLTG